MLITDITQQIKNPQRYSVFLDGEFAFGIDAVDLLYHKLEIGKILQKEQYNNLVNELEFTKAKAVAVRYLGQARSVRQMRDKLTEKEFSPANIENTIDFLMQRNYLNDIEFAKLFISHKTKISNFGRRRIENELRLKGVAEADIAAAYNCPDMQPEGENEGDDEGTARRALAKKIRNKNITEINNNPKEINRLVNFLARRGFDFELAQKIVDEQLGI